MRKNKIEIQIDYLCSVSYTAYWTSQSYQYIHKKISHLAKDISRLESFIIRKPGKIMDYWLPKVESYKMILFELNKKFG